MNIINLFYLGLRHLFNPSYPYTEKTQQSILCFLKENLGSSWQNFSYFNTQQANATQTADLRQSPNQTIYLNLFVLTASKNPSKRRLKSVFFQTSYPYLDFSYFFSFFARNRRQSWCESNFNTKDVALLRATV